MSVDLYMRRSWDSAELLFLVGPGGVGKSTLGERLAPKLGRTLFDLDLIFCDRIGVIGPFIAQHGYAAYRAANLELAEHLVETVIGPAIFVASSGFLAALPGSDDRRRAEAVLGGGYALALLPSLDLDVSTQIIVERQLSRPFGFNRDDEAQKFRMRAPACRDAADLLVVSVAAPELIAETVAVAMGAG